MNNHISIALHYPGNGPSLDPKNKRGSFHDDIAELRALLEGIPGVEIIDGTEGAELHIVLLNSGKADFLAELPDLSNMGAQIWYFIPRSTVPDEFLQRLFHRARGLQGVQGIFPYDGISEVWRKMLVLTGSKQFVPAMSGVVATSHH
ncbi:MAG: hypothetical protein RLY66_125 [Candidatus Parcubacteria bacterium]|jgi:hypothetical protein